MRSLALFLVFAIAAGAQRNTTVPPRRAAGDPAMQEIRQKYLASPEAIAAGREIYLASCSGCHGPNGEGGRGPNLLTSRAMRGMTSRRMFDTLKTGLPGTDMPPLPLPDDQIWKTTAYVRSLTAPAVESAAPGDPAAGEALFFGKGGCTGCHMIRGKGGYLGPDLTNAGLANYTTQLRPGLLEPNVRITNGFDPVRVTKLDGTVLEGVAKNHTNYGIQLLDRDGNLYVLPAADLKQVTFLEKTWMPADYGQRLSPQEIHDLLAYLSRQVTRVIDPSLGHEDEDE